MWEGPGARLDSIPSRRLREISAAVSLAKTILVVEDNAMNMKLFREILESRGYSTLRAETGLDGLRLAREHRPDLIVMDIQLPDVSGLEVTDRVKKDETLRHIPVLAVTAFVMRYDEQKILLAGCDAYIAKPISIPEFVRAVETLLARAAPQR